MRKLVFTFFFVLPQCFGQTIITLPEELLFKSYQKIITESTINYYGESLLKTFNRTDTTHMGGRVSLTRQIDDTIFKGYLYIQPTDSTTIFYDLDRIYKVNSSKKSGTFYDPHKGEKWGLAGSREYQLINNFFLDPQLISDLIKSENTLTLLSDTSYHNTFCYRIKILFPDNKQISHHQLVVFINQKDYTPVLFERYAEYQGNVQYTRLYLRDYDFTPARKIIYSSNQFPNTYVLTPYKKKENRLNDSGSIAPTIWGREFFTGKTDTLNFKSKVTVLDFWYMGCVPCIKAFPQLEKLKQKYKMAPVQVIGVNHHDNSEDRIKKIPTFLKHNHINYPFFLVENAVVNQYNVVSWPTFYVVDQNGKIAASMFGYSEDLVEQLSKIIDQLIK